LSSVPPVWPSPRPDSCGTATPNAATSGASGSVILSPTPPVECLSTVRLPSPAKLIRSPEAIIASVMTRISSRLMPLRSTAIAKAAICESATYSRVGVDHPAQRVLGHRPLVALGADDVDRVERFGRLDAGSCRGHRTDSRSRAEGIRQHLVDRADARHGLEQHARQGELVEQLAAAPAGHDRLALAVDADERDELPAARHVQVAHERAFGAQPTPYEAFSTLQPETIRPSLTSAAAPTCSGSTARTRAHGLGGDAAQLVPVDVRHRGHP
jgi:hypothetical protein